MPTNGNKPYRTAENVTRPTLVQRPSDDVAWGNVDGDDDGGLTLEPIDPEEERRRVRQREKMLTLDVAFEEDAPNDDFHKPQFTLKQLVLVQAAIAVVLAFVRAFAPGMTAGILGIAAMMLAAAITVFEPEDKRVTIVWWSLFGLYLFACVIAILLG